MRTIFFLLLLAGFKTVHATPRTSLNDTLPTISCPSYATLTTGPFDCAAMHAYNVTASDDEPGWTLTQTAGLSSGSNFPVGNTVNAFLVTDVDGNSATCSFTVTVKDYTPPVAICKGATTVAISDAEDSNDCYLPNAPVDFASVIWVNKAIFDNGSYDNCGNILLTIRRTAPYSNFVDTLNQVNGHPSCTDISPDFPSEYERAISEQDSIKFYCGEANTTQTVLLTVYQLDAYGNISIGANGAPVYNQCSIEVTVVDNINPVCIPPAEVAVSCEQFDPSLLSYGAPALSDNCCIDQLIKSANYSLFDTICNRGTITRLFSVLDCSGNASLCTQHVVVNYSQDYYVKFPDDTLVTVCNSTGVYGRPVFFGEDCELLSVSYEDEVYGIQPPDACYQIEREWTIINWCNYNPNLPLTNVPNPRLHLNSTHLGSSKGPTVSACGAAPPWNPTISKLTLNDTIDTNFCMFWNTNSNGYLYKQIIKILDTAQPIIAQCPANPLLFIDSTQNHPNYWNNVYNPNLPAKNLRETEVNLSIAATDSCSGGQLYIRYLLFLDLDADGVTESVINSQYPPPADSIYYGNEPFPNYIGGTTRAFDNRPVPQNQKWRFAIDQPLNAITKTAALRWSTTQFPNTYVVPELPVGTHKIKWIVQDGCGNESTCEYNFTIQASTFGCIAPADVAVSCEMFDPSLLTYGEPNLVSSCCIEVLFKSADYTKFDTICSRGTITRIFEALDCCGNTSQCTQRVVVNYAQDYYIRFPNDVYTTSCNGTGIYGEPTSFGEDCEMLGVAYEDAIIDPVPDACIIIERVWTVINWCTFNPLQNITYVPNPTPNAIISHPANLPGPIVSACGTAPPWAPTIVKINPSDPTPTDFCTFWSANANGYKYTQHIKIIDSEAPTFLNCVSVPSHWSDPTPNDPIFWNNVFNPDLPAKDLQEIPFDLSITATDACSGANISIEYLLFLDLDADNQPETVVNSVNVGIAGLGWNKVLYNNIATPNFTGGTSTTFDNRSVPMNQKWGFSIQETISGNNKIAAVRWNTQQAQNNHVVPELPNGRHKIKWFVTDGCGNNKECEQFFSIGDTTLVGTYMPDHDGFVLYQNEPNPFGESTVIRFQLPEYTTATLSVFDAEGKEVFSQTSDYPPGMHAVTLEKERLGAPGVLYYKLEAGAYVAWRKMVVQR